VLVSELIARGASRHRDRPAVLVGDETMTFGEVAALAARLARALLALELRPGDRVALLLDNGPLSIPTDFALVLGGFVRVPLNARLSEDEHAQMVTGAGCATLLHEGRHEPRSTALRERCPGLRLVPLDDSGDATEPLTRVAASQPDGPPDVHLSADDPLLALFTSGTTGQLKAAVHTHASWAAITRNILGNLLSPGPDDVMLHAASLVHASGTFVLPFWLRGGAAAVLPGFEPGSWFDAVERYGATAANVVPTMLQMLLAHPGAGTVPGGTLSTVVYGASPMPRSVITRGLAAWGPVFVQYYGQTEAPLCMTVLTKQDHVGPDADRLLGSCGFPAVDAELRLVDESGAVVADGPGELQVRAPFTMAGYLDADELTGRTLLADGWVATRDVARRDERGYLHLVDRTSDMIVTGGYNVYPREVEDVLLDHPDVLEAAVVAAPHEVWVEAVTAFVVLSPGSTVDGEALREHVRSRVAGHKVPKSVHLVDAVPKSAVGKVLRRALRDPLWADADQVREGRL